MPTKILGSDQRLLAAIALKGAGAIATIEQRSDIRLLTLTTDNRAGLLGDILQLAMNTYHLQEG